MKKFGIVIFPGTNCEHDCYWVIKHVMNQDVSYIWHKDTNVQDYDCLIIPGGFSYGDYLRTGAIAKFSPVMGSVKKFAHDGGLVLGICNGFQILLESGLLPGVMVKNKNLKFICKNVTLSVENNSSPFTTAVNKPILKMPIRHAEGNFYCDKNTLAGLKDNNQIILKYCSSSGETSDEFNPNGSVENIAGICNKDKNVFGLMPHPEAACDIFLGSNDGKTIFESLMA